jgi:Co/Zn/Cd efflux system component
MSSTPATTQLDGLTGPNDYEDDTDEHDLSVAAFLLETIANAAATEGVATIGAIIQATGGWYWLDPVVAIAIASVVAYHAIAPIRKVLIRLLPIAADSTGLSVTPLIRNNESCSAKPGL